MFALGEAPGVIGRTHVVVHAGLRVWCRVAPRRVEACVGSDLS